MHFKCDLSVYIFGATVCKLFIYIGSYSLWYNHLCLLMYYFLTLSDQLLFTTTSYHGFPVWLESAGGHDVYWNLAGILFGGCLCSNPPVSVYSVHSKNFKVTALLFAIQLLIQVCFLMKTCRYNPYSENYTLPSSGHVSSSNCGTQWYDIEKILGRTVFLWQSL